MVTARDGTELYTEVYRPNEPASGSILFRTPYNARSGIFTLLILRLVQEGFAVVLQDCRGRYGSAGEFDLTLEGRDGEDTLHWLTEQDWWGGRIGLLGTCISSAFAASLISQCPSLLYFANVSLGGVTDLYAACYSSLGVLFLHHHLPFQHLISGKTQAYKGDVDWQVMFEKFPHSAQSIHCSANVRDLFQAIREHRRKDGFWEKLGCWSPELAKVPTLFVTGTYDLWNRAAIADFERASRQAEVPHRLILGPWDHSALIKDLVRYKQRDLGRYVFAEIVNWYKQMAAHQPSNRKPVSCYLTGAGHWVDKDDWECGKHNLYLDLSRDQGVLAAEPSTFGSKSFKYDPFNPVPTIGGAVWPIGSLAPGPKDQRPLEGRADILSCLGSPLKKSVSVAGNSAVQLWVSSSAKETHFTAKLVDLCPDGSQRIIADGITLFQGGDQLKMITIDLGPISHVFAPGHRIQLDISSSNFPKYERHFNAATRDKAEIALQTVVSAPANPSFLILPAVTGD